MDIKHNFSIHPEFPVYSPISSKKEIAKSSAAQFQYVEGGVVEIGYAGIDFCFDNELPRHPFLLSPFLFATQLVTNGEYLEFMGDNGYQRPQWWLAEGWECVQKNNWDSPLYWHKLDNHWHIFTLNGLQPLNLSEPVSHIS